MERKTTERPVVMRFQSDMEDSEDTEAMYSGEETEDMDNTITVDPPYRKKELPEGDTTVLVHVLFPQHIGSDEGVSSQDRRKWLDEPMIKYQKHLPDQVRWTNLRSFGTAEHATAGYLIDDTTMWFIDTGADPLRLKSVTCENKAARDDLITRMTSTNNAFQSVAEVEALFNLQKQVVDLPLQLPNGESRTIDPRFICHGLRQGLTSQFAADCCTRSVLTLFLYVMVYFQGWHRALQCETFLRNFCLRAMRERFNARSKKVLQAVTDFDIWNLLLKDYPNFLLATGYLGPARNERFGDRRLTPQVSVNKSVENKCEDTKLTSPGLFHYLLQQTNSTLIGFLLHCKTPDEASRTENELLPVLQAAILFPKQRHLFTDVAIVAVLLSWISHWPDRYPTLRSVATKTRVEPKGYMCLHFFSVREIRLLTQYLPATVAGMSSNIEKHISDEQHRAEIEQLNNKCDVDVYVTHTNQIWRQYVQTLALQPHVCVRFVTLLNQVITNQELLQGLMFLENATCDSLFEVEDALLNERWPARVPDVMPLMSILGSFAMMRDGGPVFDDLGLSKTTVQVRSDYNKVFYYPDHEFFWAQNLMTMRNNALALWRQNPSHAAAIPILIGLFGRDVPALEPIVRPQSESEMLFNLWLRKEVPHGINSKTAKNYLLFGAVLFLSGKCQVHRPLLSDLQPDAPAAKTPIVAAFAIFVARVLRSKLVAQWQPVSQRLVIQIYADRLTITNPWSYRGKTYTFEDPTLEDHPFLSLSSNDFCSARLVDQDGVTHWLLVLEPNVPDVTKNLFVFPKVKVVVHHAILRLEPRLIVPAAELKLVMRCLKSANCYTGLTQICVPDKKEDRRKISHGVDAMVQEKSKLRSWPKSLEQAKLLVERFPGPAWMLVQRFPRLREFVGEMFGGEMFGGLNHARKWRSVEVAFMLSTGKVPRLDQSQAAHTLHLASRTPGCFAFEFLMGRGKSQVILPLVVMRHMQEGKSVDWVVPDHLWQQTNDTMAFLAVEQWHNEALGVCYVHKYSEYLRTFDSQTNKAARLLLVDELDTLADPRTSEVIVGSQMEFHTLSNSALFVSVYCAAVARCVEFDTALQKWYVTDAIKAMLAKLQAWQVHLARITSAVAQANDMRICVQFGPTSESWMAVPYSSFNRPREGSTFKSEDLMAVLTVIMWKTNSVQMKDRLPREKVAAEWRQSMAHMKLRPKPNEPTIETLLQCVILPTMRVATKFATRNFHDMCLGRNCIAVSGTHMVTLLPQLGWTQAMVPDVQGTEKVRQIFQGRKVQMLAQNELFIHLATNNLQCLIDGSAEMAETELSTNRMVAQKWQETLRTKGKTQGVFYFEADRVLHCETQRALTGADTDMCLYFDQGHTVGVDLPLSKDMKGLLLLRPTTTLKDAAQAAFRMRHVTRENCFIAYIPTHERDGWPEGQDLYELLAVNEQNMLSRTSRANLVQAQEAVWRSELPHKKELVRALTFDLPDANPLTQFVFTTANVVLKAENVECDEKTVYFPGTKTKCVNVVTRVFHKLGFELTPAAMLVAKQNMLTGKRDKLEVMAAGKATVVCTWVEWLALRSQGYGGSLVPDDESNVGLLLVRGTPIGLGQQLMFLDQLQKREMTSDEMQILQQVLHKLPRLFEDACHSQIGTVIDRYLALGEEKSLDLVLPGVEEAEFAAQLELFVASRDKRDTDERSSAKSRSRSKTSRNKTSRSRTSRSRTSRSRSRTSRSRSRTSRRLSRSRTSRRLSRSRTSRSRSRPRRKKSDVE